MRTLRLVMIALVAALAGTLPSLADTCFLNASEDRLFLALDTADARKTGWRDPGGSICTSAEPPTVTVSAFTDRDVFEGCSRRVPGGVETAILEYQGVDLCIWRTE